MSNPAPTADILDLAKTTAGVFFLNHGVICQSDGKGGACGLCYEDGKPLPEPSNPQQKRNASFCIATAKAEDVLPLTTEQLLLASRNRVKTWYINRLREGTINMADTETTEVVGSYQHAVNEAHRIWQERKQKTGVTVHDTHHCLYYWHRIAGDGRAEDRNTNSGVVFANQERP